MVGFLGSICYATYSECKSKFGLNGLLKWLHVSLWETWKRQSFFLGFSNAGGWQQFIFKVYWFFKVILHFVDCSSQKMRKLKMRFLDYFVNKFCKGATKSFSFKLLENKLINCFVVVFLFSFQIQQKAICIFFQFS